MEGWMDVVCGMSDKSGACLTTQTDKDSKVRLCVWVCECFLLPRCLLCRQESSGQGQGRGSKGAREGVGKGAQAKGKTR